MRNTLSLNINKVTLYVLIVLCIGSVANAESVYVKYRGNVDLQPFKCESISHSSLVNRVCYDKKEQYMIIGLRGTYYHYCEISQDVVSNLLTAESMGQYYNQYIKGNYDCRVNRMPTYNK